MAKEVRRRGAGRGRVREVEPVEALVVVGEVGMAVGEAGRATAGEGRAGGTPKREGAPGQGEIGEGVTRAGPLLPRGKMEETGQTVMRGAGTRIRESTWGIRTMRSS